MKFILPLLFLGISSLFAQNWTTGVLKAKQGTLLYFALENYNLYCDAYGVYTMQRFLANEDVPGDCKSKLKEHYPKIKRRYMKELNMRLKREQMYHIEAIDQKCIVLFSDSKSYSEVMLRNGLGIKEKEFETEDEGLSYALQKAEAYARKNRRGVWSDPFLAKCFQATK